jgi:hypothetical protein
LLQWSEFSNGIVVVSLPAGVLTPAAAFYDAPSIFQLLKDGGLQFEVVEDFVATPKPADAAV